MIYYLQWIAFRSVKLICGWLRCRRLVVMLAKSAGWIHYVIDTSRRKMLIERALQHQLADTPREIRRQVAGVFKSFYLTLVDFATAEQTLEKDDTVSFENIEMAKSALAKGKGAVVVSVHLGNWEYAGYATAKAGLPISAVARRNFNPYIEAEQDTLRTRFGLEVIRPGKSTFQRIMQALKQGKMVTFLLDITSNKHSTAVEFLGVEHHVNLAPLLLAQKSGAPILVAYTFRKSSLKHVVYFADCIEISAKKREYDRKQMLKCILAPLKTAVKSHPDQWLWVAWLPEATITPEN